MVYIILGLFGQFHSVNGFILFVDRHHIYESVHVPSILINNWSVRVILGIPIQSEIANDPILFVGHCYLYFTLQ